MRPPSVPADTEPEIFDMLVERWRSMTIAERVALFEQLNADVEALAVAGIRALRPGLADAETRFELACRRYGSDLARAAYPQSAT